MLIIYEPAVLAKVKILNGRINERPKKVDIQEDGQIILYYGSGPRWWQRFFNAHGLVSITDIAIKLADTMSGTGEARNEEKKLKPRFCGLSFFERGDGRLTDCHPGTDILTNPASGTVVGIAEGFKFSLFLFEFERAAGAVVAALAASHADLLINFRIVAASLAQIEHLRGKDHLVAQPGELPLRGNGVAA